MLNIKVKVLEGRNLYGKSNIIYLRLNNKNDKNELFEMVEEYKTIQKELNINSNIEVREKDNIIEVIIKESYIYIANFIIQSIINGLDKEFIISESKRLKILEWDLEIRNEALKENIPYMKVEDEEIILGYGVNSLRINKDEYINFYKENYYKIIDDFKKNVGIIPIISVSGTNGKTTTVRLIHNMLLNLGYNSGLSSTGGIYIGDIVIRHGDTTGFYSAREVLKNKWVNVAVLETARGGILKKGLGYIKAKVAIITSISEDHIGVEDIKSLDDLINIKSLIAEELDNDGVLVIKAIPTLIDKFKDKNNVILFNDDINKLIENHIKGGNIAYYVKENYIVKNYRGVEEKIISIEEIPFAFNGKSKSNIRNIMVAIIAIENICKDIKKVTQCVKKLECNIYTNLGRQNIIDFNKFKMIIDYGHNSEAFNEVFSIAKSMPHKRIIGLITAAGDRKDIYIEELGEIAAKFCDLIIIKEQPDLRGRVEGETANLLKCGALKVGFDKKNIKMILKEEDAVLQALRNAKDEDIIVSFSQFLYLTFPAINLFRKEIGLQSIGEDLDLTH